MGLGRAEDGVILGKSLSMYLLSSAINLGELTVIVHGRINALTWPTYILHPRIAGNGGSDVVVKHAGPLDPALSAPQFKGVWLRQSSEQGKSLASPIQLNCRRNSLVFAFATLGPSQSSSS